MARPGLGRRLARAWDALTGSGYAPAYKGARMHRGNSDWPTTTRSSKQEIQSSIRPLRARARDLSRNNPYARSFLNLLVSNVVGPTGIQVRSQVRDRAGELRAAVNDRIDAAWMEWATGKVTLDRRLNLVQALSLILENAATDGELLVRMVTSPASPFGFALQLVDADLLDERYDRPAAPGRNEIRMAVEIEATGAPLGYWAWKGIENFGYPRTGPREFIPAWDPLRRTGEALHPFMPRRLNQTRGVSWFHPVVDTLDGMGAYSEAELFGARVGASSTVLISPGEDSIEDEKDKPAATSELEVAPGAAFRLRAGDVPHFWEPKHPTDQVGPFMKVLAREVGMGLGAPYYALANDLESTSFSSMRGGEAIARPLWRWIQEWLIAEVLRPVREQWLNAAILSGALDVGSIDAAAFRLARYKGRGWPYVNPLDEIRANALALQCGTTSRQRILAESTGDDYYEVLEELKDEQEAARAAGISIDPPQSLSFELAKADAAGAGAGGAPGSRELEQPRGATTDGDGNGGAGGAPASVPEPIRRRLFANGATPTRR